MVRTTLIVILIVASVWSGNSVHGQELANKGRVDCRGDALPAGAVARLGTLRWRIGESPLLFTSDARHAVAVGHHAFLLDALTGLRLRTFDVIAQQAFLTPDDKTLIAASGEWGDVAFLDIETGKVVRRLPIKGRKSAWSADGMRMASQKFDISSGPSRATLTVWDLKTGKTLHTWDGIRGNFVLSPDGTTLAVRDRDQITLFDAVKGTELHRWRSLPVPAGQTSQARVLLFSPDGKMLASTESERVALWDPATGKQLTKGKLGSFLAMPKSAADTVAFSREGRFLAAGSSTALYVWDLVAEKLLHKIDNAGNGLPIYVVEFTPDAKTLISHAHTYPSARLWDMATGKEMSPVDANASRVDAVTFSADGKTIATIGPGDPVGLWEAETGKVVRRFPVDSYMGLNWGGGLSYLPGSKSLAAIQPGRVWLWNLDTGKSSYQTHRNPTHFDPEWQVDIRAHCALDADTMIATFPGEEKRVIGGGRMPVFRIHWAMIGVWDLRTRKMLRSFRVDAEDIRSLGLSPDRKTLVGLPDGQSHLFAWDIATGVEMMRIPLPPMMGPSPTFSADGRTLFVSSFQNQAGGTKLIVHLYEVASGKKRAGFEHPWPENARTYHIIASDRLMAITKNDEVALLDPLTGKKYRRFKNGGGWIGCLAFSPDGKRLVTGHEDTTALVWDISDALPALPRTRMTKQQLETAWAELAGDDAEVAHKTIRLMSQAPEDSAPFLGQQLKPVAPVKAEVLQRLLAKLDSSSFAERDQAGRELLHLGEAAEAALGQFLQKPVSLETRRRADDLVARIREARLKRPWILSGDALREARAVEVLQRIGNAEATALLDLLANGSPHASLTRQARSVLPPSSADR